MVRKDSLNLLLKPEMVTNVHQAARPATDKCGHISPDSLWRQLEGHDNSCPRGSDWCTPWNYFICTLTGPPQRMEEGGKGRVYVKKRKTELWILVFLLSILTHCSFKVTIRIYIFIEVLLSIVTWKRKYFFPAAADRGSKMVALKVSRGKWKY